MSGPTDERTHIPPEADEAVASVEPRANGLKPVAINISKF